MNRTLSTHSLEKSEGDCFRRTNWEAICNIASQANSGKKCQLLPDYRKVGGSSLARLLGFEDGTRWIARVQLRKSTSETSQRLRAEIDTISLLKDRTKAPVPRIMAFRIDDANPARSAFVLLECFPGNTAAEEARRYETTDSCIIPLRYREVFFRTTAAAHVQIASARLPQIGIVLRQVDGSFALGPIPGIGGPFDTAASFIQARASIIKFPYSESYLRQALPISVADEIVEGNSQFPSRLATLASRHFIRDGPFPVRHADFFHSNIVVDKAFEVVGVIDWEGSYTVPWELIDGPCFLSTVPRLLNLPEKYGEAGWPLDKDEAGSWADEEMYVDMIRDAERDAHTDHRLSQILSDRDSRDLARIIHLYAGGKMGLYGRALDYFENKGAQVTGPLVQGMKANRYFQKRIYCHRKNA